jgi:hypothetical protein
MATLLSLLGFLLKLRGRHPFPVSARSIGHLSGNCQGAAEIVTQQDTTMPGKRIRFDQKTWNALDLLAKDSMRDFQDLADEAFADLLRKHGRPVELQTALRQSVSEIEKRPAAPSVQRRDASKKARRGE